MSAHAAFFAATTSSGTSLTVTNTGAIPAGAVILFGVRAGGTIGCSDTANGTFTLIDNDGNGRASFIFANTAASLTGADTVTASGTVTGAIRIAGDVFSGVALAGQPAGHTFIAAPGDPTAGATTITAPGIAGDPGGNVDWAVLAGPQNTGTLGAGATNGAAMTLSSQVVGANGGAASEWALSTVAGTQAATIVFSAGSSVGSNGFLQVTLSAGISHADAPTGVITLASNMAENSTLGDQILRPSSDIATAGWTVAPLFSKINDQSDSTSITATLA